MLSYFFSVFNITKVHNAYVIALEDEARQELDRFTAGQQVQAVDMTQVCSASPGIHTTGATTLPTKAASRAGSQSADPSSRSLSPPLPPRRTAATATTSINSLSPSSNGSSIDSSPLELIVSAHHHNNRPKKGTGSKTKPGNSRKKKKSRQEDYPPESLVEEYTVIDNPVYGSLSQVQQALGTGR